jgi:hypothetical protein
MTSILFKFRRKTTTLEVRESGTHATVKITGNVTTLLESSRMHVQPQKGMSNPPHIQHKANKGFLALFKK